MIQLFNMPCFFADSIKMQPLKPFYNITYLLYQFPAPYLNIVFKNLIFISGYPNYMSRKNRYGMITPFLCFHNTKLIKCEAT